MPGGGGTSSPMLAALELARKGIKVFPCRPYPEGKNGAKSPRVGGGFKAATTDEKKIHKWWGDWPDSLIGVPTGKASGFNVLDLDLKGKTIEERLAQLPEPPPNTRMHTTRSGGRHYLFKVDRPLKTTEGTTQAGPCIDTRGEGGYIIWWPAHGGSASGEALAPTPQWLPEPGEAPAAKTVSPVVSATIAALGWPITRKQIERELHAIDPDVEHEGWYRIGMAIYHESGGIAEGLTMWDSWSAKGKKYKPGECATRWRSFATSREDRVTWSGAARAAANAPAASQEPTEAPTGRPKGLYNGPELYEMTHADPEPIIDGSLVLSPGVWILAGKPKDGKTWLAQNLACAVLSGREYAGSKPKAPGGVVYMNLDDGNTGRFFRRLRDMGLTKEESAGLILAMGVDAEHYPNAFEMVKAMLELYPGIRMVVIDTLGSFRTNERKEGVYQQEYGEVKAINELAHAHNILVLLVHHFRKGAIDTSYPFESISGTLGLQGGADGMIVLHRKDYHHPTDESLDQKLGAIWCRGRDLDGDIELGARLHDGQWRIIGGVDDVLMSNALHEVLNVMRQQPERWFTSKEVAAEIDGAKADTVRKALQRAVKRGTVISRVGNGGGFRLKG